MMEVWRPRPHAGVEGDEVQWRRGKYLLLMTHFAEDDIPHVWHLLDEVHRTKA
jgi:hypothetical protein